MRCKICEEIEGALRSAKSPDDSAGALGLSEAGERNRTHQKAERILSLELKLARHKKACPDQVSRTP